MYERGYTRHYQDVAAEIQARSAFYRGLAEAPPPHSEKGRFASATARLRRGKKAR